MCCLDYLSPFPFVLNFMTLQHRFVNPRINAIAAVVFCNQYYMKNTVAIFFFLKSPYLGVHTSHGICCILCSGHLIGGRREYISMILCWVSTAAYRYISIYSVIQSFEICKVNIFATDFLPFWHDTWTCIHFYYMNL